MHDDDTFACQKRITVSSKIRLSSCPSLVLNETKIIPMSSFCLFDNGKEMWRFLANSILLNTQLFLTEQMFLIVRVLQETNYSFSD